jgi:Peptidase family S41
MMVTPMYLGPDRAGVRWLLDPTSPDLVRLAKDADARSADSPCDPEAVAEDLAELPALLAERHFGIATGVITTQSADEAASLILTARARVLRSRPRRWGDALGDLNDALRLTLHDRHVFLNGSRPSTIRAGEPAFNTDPATPAVEMSEQSGVLCISLRRLWGGAEDDRRLWDWAADSLRCFEHDRMVVDLRGNGGGNDSITHRWISPVLPAAASVPGTSADWYVGDTPLNVWNTVAILEASRGAAAVPSWHREHLRQPTPGDTLAIKVEHDDSPLPTGERPWSGEMLVLTDCNTASAGEWSAWMLQHALSARLVGGRTAGVIEYGNIAPYLLPASGLHVMLPTKHNDLGQPVELVGLPVHAQLDPRTPLSEVARSFDDLYLAAERTAQAT